LSADRKRWRPARAGGTWLLPGDAVAAAMRRGFDQALRAAAPDLHAQVPDSVWRDGWWVHTQPAGSGQAVVRYLARYVQRTAISDERLVAANDQAVTFAYTDTASQQRRQCTLSADEFLRRYLQHVLPSGQHRVRYFGWLHPAAKARRMIVDEARQRGEGQAAGMARSEAEGERRGCPPRGQRRLQTLLAVVIIVHAKVDAPPPWHLQCRCCGQFTLVRIGSLPRGPPTCQR
jgi:hypothetical protein